MAAQIEHHLGHKRCYRLMQPIFSARPAGDPFERAHTGPLSVTTPGERPNKVGLIFVGENSPRERDIEKGQRKACDFEPINWA
jgi:hypothetical protein